MSHGFAQYEDILSHLRSLPLHQVEWAYPAFVKSAEALKAENMKLGKKNVGTSELAVNREVLMCQVEIKLNVVMVVQEKEVPTQQMVTQELAPLHVGFSASAKHTTRLRTQIDLLKAAGFFIPRLLVCLQAAVER